MATAVINPGGSTIVVGGTEQLSVVGLTLDGKVIPTLDSVKYKSLDLTTLTVDANGLVTALRATTTNASSGAVPVQIQATVYAGGVTRTASAYISVTATRLPVASLDIHSGVTSIPLGTTNFIKPVFKDSSGNDLSDAGIYATRVFPAGAAVANVVIWNGLVQPYGLGQYWLYATTTAYGITLSDSVLLTFGNRTALTVYFINDFTTSQPIIYMNGFTAHTQFYLGAGAVVTFTNQFSYPVAVTFDDSTHVTGGNIASLAAFASVTRTFPTTGHFSWTETGSPKPLSAAFDIK